MFPKNFSSDYSSGALPMKTDPMTELAGVGMCVSPASDGGLKIASLLKTGVAKSSGQIQIGDLLVAVGGVELMNKTANEASDLIRGPLGTDVVLKVRHPDSRGGFAAPIDVTLTRRHAGLGSRNSTPVSSPVPSVSPLPLHSSSAMREPGSLPHQPNFDSAPPQVIPPPADKPISNPPKSDANLVSRPLPDQERLHIELAPIALHPNDRRRLEQPPSPQSSQHSETAAFSSTRPMAGRLAPPPTVEDPTITDEMCPPPPISSYPPSSLQSRAAPPASQWNQGPNPPNGNQHLPPYPPFNPTLMQPPLTYPPFPQPPPAGPASQPPPSHPFATQPPPSQPQASSQPFAMQPPSQPSPVGSTPQPLSSQPPPSQPPYTTQAPAQPQAPPQPPQSFYQPQPPSQQPYATPPPSQVDSQLPTHAQPRAEMFVSQSLPPPPPHAPLTQSFPTQPPAQQSQIQTSMPTNLQPPPPQSPFSLPPPPPHLQTLAPEPYQNRTSTNPIEINTQPHPVSAAREFAHETVSGGRFPQQQTQIENPAPPTSAPPPAHFRTVAMNHETADRQGFPGFPPHAPATSQYNNDDAVSVASSNGYEWQELLSRERRRRIAAEEREKRLLQRLGGRGSDAGSVVSVTEDQDRMFKEIKIRAARAEARVSVLEGELEGCELLLKQSDARAAELEAHVGEMQKEIHREKNTVEILTKRLEAFTERGGSTGEVFALREENINLKKEIELERVKSENSIRTYVDEIETLRRRLSAGDTHAISNSINFQNTAMKESLARADEGRRRAEEALVRANRDYQEEASRVHELQEKLRAVEMRLLSSEMSETLRKRIEQLEGQIRDLNLTVAESRDRARTAEMREAEIRDKLFEERTAVGLGAEVIRRELGAVLGINLISEKKNDEDKAIHEVLNGSSRWFSDGEFSGETLLSRLIDNKIPKVYVSEQKHNSGGESATDFPRDAIRLAMLAHVSAKDYSQTGGSPSDVHRSQYASVNRLVGLLTSEAPTLHVSLGLACLCEDSVGRKLVNACGGAVEGLIYILSTTSPVGEAQTLRYCVLCLSLLAEDEDTRPAILRQRPDLHRLAECMRSSDQPLVRYTANLSRQLCSAPEFSQTAHASVGFLSEIRRLGDSEDGQTRAYAQAAVRNLEKFAFAAEKYASVAEARGSVRMPNSMITL